MNKGCSPRQQLWVNAQSSDIIVNEFNRILISKKNIFVTICKQKYEKCHFNFLLLMI